MADAALGSVATTNPAGMPALPRGAVVFENIPLEAVVISALAPALGDGSLVVRAADRSAVILVRGGSAAEVHAYTPDGRRSGDALLEEVQGWTGAAVWAHRLEPALMAVSSALLTGEPVYEDLRLSWLSWPALLDDLAARGDAWLVEVTSPAGTGVLCLAPGRSSLSFTDGQPPSRSGAAIEALVAGANGTVRVRRLDSAAFGETQPAPHSATLASVPDAAPTPARVPAAATAEQRAPVNGAAPPEAAQSAPVAAGPAELQRAVEDALTDLAWVAPWDASWKEEGATGAPGEPAAAARPVDIRVVLPDLRSIAQRRLQLSASRVEAVLDQAADQHLPLDTVLDEIRSMSIRGVMQSTVQDMVDEMAAAAAHRAV